MSVPIFEKAQYYATRANELKQLAQALAEPARAEMLAVVAEYERLAKHWARAPGTNYKPDAPQPA